MIRKGEQVFLARFDLLLRAKPWLSAVDEVNLRSSRPPNRMRPCVTRVTT
jgi:hypothetical protein